MKIIVTGSEGYLGSVLVPYLKSLDHEIFQIDRCAYGQGDDLEYAICNTEDVADPSTWDRNWGGAEAVVNLAALVGEPLCSKYPEEARRTNVVGTFEAANWCKEHNAKFIHISTCSNYGVSEGIANEETDLKPLGVYAETKCASEIQANRADEFTTFRFGTLYGPSPRMRWDVMINEWVYDYLRNMVLDVYNPQAHRPFLHISDACKAIQTALEQRESTKNQIFNVAGLNITKLKLASILTSVGECNYNTFEQASDQRDYQVDTEKFSAYTGFTYQHTMENLEADLEEIRLFALVRKTSNVEDFVMPND